MVISGVFVLHFTSFLMFNSNGFHGAGFTISHLVFGGLHEKLNYAFDYHGILVSRGNNHDLGIHQIAKKKTVPSERVDWPALETSSRHNYRLGSSI